MTPGCGRPEEAGSMTGRYDVVVDGEKVREFEAGGLAAARTKAALSVHDAIAACGEGTTETRLIRVWVSDQNGERIIHVGVTTDPAPVRCTGGGHEWERTDSEEDDYYRSTDERCKGCGLERTHVFDKDGRAEEAFTVTTYGRNEDAAEEGDCS